MTRGTALIILGTLAAFGLGYMIGREAGLILATLDATPATTTGEADIMASPEADTTGTTGTTGS